VSHPQGSIASLYRYPVKGLSPERLDSVALTAGDAFPFDRVFAIENGKGRFDPDAPKFLPKINFLMLMRDERLASLSTRFDPTTSVLTILRDGKHVSRGDLSSQIGRQMIEQFIGAFMQDALRGAPHVVAAPGHSFADCGEKVVHIVNLASVRDLASSVGQAVDPIRFRANLYLDGFAPWSELGWSGKTLTIGSATLTVTEPTVRCAATNVDPATGVRDLALPQHIERRFGHTHFGIYAVVKSATSDAAPLQPGQAVVLQD
jgi:uncharacterized protein